MTLIWTQQLNWIKNKQHITIPNRYFEFGWLNWGGLILQQNITACLTCCTPKKGTPTDSISFICLPEEKTQSRLALDPSYHEIDMRVFHQADWTDFYGDVKKAIPDNAPEPRATPSILRAFVDSDHAND